MKKSLEFNFNFDFVFKLKYFKKIKAKGSLKLILLKTFLIL